MKLKYFVDLARPQHNLAAALAAAASYLVASDGYIGYSILVPLIVAILLDAGGMASNDYFDAEIDKGRADRPIVSGLIRRDDAIVFAGGLLLVAMIIAALSRNYLLIIAACMLSVMGSVYNIKTKRCGLLGNINVGLTVCWYTVLGWSGYSDQIFDLRLLFLFLTLVFVGTSTAAAGNFDMAERYMKLGIRTTPTIYGTRRAAAITALFRFLEIVCCVLVLVTADLLNFVTVSMVVVLGMLLIAMYKYLLGSEDVRNARIAFNICVLSNIVTFLTIIVGATSKRYLGW